MQNSKSKVRPSPGEITLLLTDLTNPESLKSVMRLAYSELHDIAVHHVRGEAPGRTWQPTELVNEICLRFIEKRAVFKNRRYFFVAASTAMRRILVSSARRRRAKKHGGGWRRVDFSEAERIGFEQPTDLLDFDAALKQLTAEKPLWAEAAELRIFGGWSSAETATILSVSASTVRRRWGKARARLHATLRSLRHPS